MKRCPTCEKTFDDNLRFCQADGTPLVDAEEELDPYKTMVAKPGEIAAALAANKGADEASKEDSVLELPDEPDPNKTQFVSEKELRDEMAAADNHEVMDLPPEPPKFNEPEPPSPPKMGGPPPSPFDQSPREAAPDQFSQTSPPIPSPFGGSPEPIREESPAPKFEEPEPPKPQFSEPEPAEPKFDPFEAQAPTAPPPASMQQSPPPMGGPVAQMGGSAAAPPANTAAAPSKTLALVSLVLGILGFTLCCGTVVPSLVAIITGVMARGKAKNDPANYEGAGLAMGGIITGVIGLLLSVGYLIFVMFFGGLQMIMQSM